LDGTMLCSKHVLPYMREKGSGHILNLYGGGGGTGAAAYVVSKDAIKSLTHFIAEEEREAGIFVAALSPGGTIATEMAPEEAGRALRAGPGRARHYVVD